MYKTRPITIYECEPSGVIEDLISNKSKFPYHRQVRNKSCVFPYPIFEIATYQKKEFFEETMRVCYSETLSDFQKEEKMNEIAMKIWLHEKTTGGRKNGTGGRNPEKHRKFLNYEKILKKCFTNCEECGIVLNYYFGANRWFYEESIKCDRPSLDRIQSVSGYTDANTRVICFTCNTLKGSNDIGFRLKQDQKQQFGQKGEQDIFTMFDDDCTESCEPEILKQIDIFNMESL